MMAEAAIGLGSLPVDDGPLGYCLIVAQRVG